MLKLEVINKFIKLVIKYKLIKIIKIKIIIKILKSFKYYWIY